MVSKILTRFETDNKIIYKKGWVGILNFIKHQNYKSDLVLKGIENELEKIPEEIKGYIYPIYIDSNTHLVKLSLVKLDIDSIKGIEKEKKEENEKLNIQINDCYNLYPSKCPIKERRTNKGNKDKVKLKALIKKFNYKYVYETIYNYVEEREKAKEWFPDFSKMLNNFPEPEKIEWKGWD